jgi:uncharacterized protein (TIGR02145 family)
VAPCIAYDRGILQLADTSWKDARAIRVLKAFDSLHAAEPSTPEAARRSALVQVYAKLLLARDPVLHGFPVEHPGGLDTAAVIDSLIALASRNSQSLGTVDSASGLDSAAVHRSVRKLASAIGIDSTKWFPVAVPKDTIPPQVDVLSPDRDSLGVSYPVATYSLIVKASDSGGIDSISVDGKGYHAAQCTVQVKLAVGWNTVRIDAWDRSGNHLATPLTRSIRRAPDPGDTVPPRIHRTAPVQDTITVDYETRRYTLAWSVRDDSLDQVLVGNQTLQTTDSVYRDTVPLRVGIDTFVLSAQDKHGNPARDTVRITRLKDTSHPQLAYQGGKKDTVVPASTSRFVATWKVQDNALVSVKFGGTKSMGSGPLYSDTVALVSDSTWIAIAATDSCSNTSTDSILVRRLVGASASPAGGIQTATANVTLSTRSKVDSIQYRMGAGAWTSYSGAPLSITSSQILYFRTWIGSLASPVDSAIYLFKPTITPASGPVSGTVQLSIQATGATIEDSLSTGTTWSTHTTDRTLTSSVSVFARSRLGNLVSLPVSATYAFPPVLNPPTKSDTESISIALSAPGSDSIEISADSLKWTRSDATTIAKDSSGKVFARAWIRGILSGTSSGTYHVAPKAPSILPASGGYASTQYVELASPTGASLQYSLNGGEWTAWAGTNFAITANSSLKVRAIKPGMDTTQVTGQYLIHTEIPWTYSYYQTFRDPRDGQTYRTVQIGYQTWFANNLNFAGESGTTSGSCIADTVDYCGKYGRQYNWAEAMGLATSDTNRAIVPANATGMTDSDWSHEPRRGACPVGWHVPSGADMFDTLKSTVLEFNGSTNDLLATLGRSTMIGPHGNTVTLTDSYGSRFFDDNFWLSSESSSNMADMLAVGVDVFRWSQYHSKRELGSVRCLKD